MYACWVCLFFWWVEGGSALSLATICLCLLILHDIMQCTRSEQQWYIFFNCSLFFFLIKFVSICAYSLTVLQIKPNIITTPSDTKYFSYLQSVPNSFWAICKQQPTAWFGLRKCLLDLTGKIVSKYWLLSCNNETRSPICQYDKVSVLTAKIPKLFSFPTNGRYWIMKGGV